MRVRYDLSPCSARCNVRQLPGSGLSGRAYPQRVAPQATCWNGGVAGLEGEPQPLRPDGGLPYLYREYRLDRDAIAEAVAKLFLGDGEE
jgi:pyruvate dehydrogenase E1 component